MGNLGYAERKDWTHLSAAIAVDWRRTEVPLDHLREPGFCGGTQRRETLIRLPHPGELIYVQDPAPLSAQFDARLRRDAIALCEALGYDMNTVELAVRGGIPYAIDFMNCAPDADRHSVGESNFEWVVNNMAEVLIESVESERPFELTGTWPVTMSRSQS